MPTLSEILKADPCRRCPPKECSFGFRNRLSLTRELNRGGCAHYYMNSAFPRLAGYVRSLNLPKGDLVAEAPKGWESFMGTAFDRRLRYEYEPDYTDDVVKVGAQLLAYPPPEEVEPGVFEGQMGPTKYIAVQEGLTNEDLDMRSIYAAVADTEFRSGRGSNTWDALEAGGEELQGALIADLHSLLTTARANLSLSSPIFGPTFGISSHWIGGADADIIDEGSLIDVKCVKNIEATAFIRQVIAYALLDVENEYDLGSVGIYLARQGILWKIPLDDVAKASNMTISELRVQAPWGDPEDRECLGARIKQSNC